MKILRRRVRRSFLFAAIGFLLIGFADLARQDYGEYGISPLHHFGFIAFCIVQGAIYAGAWYSTRTPSPYRNNLAVTGSLFTLAWAAYDLWLHHTDIMAARGGLVCLVLAVAGLYVFGQGGSPVKPEASTPDASAQQSAATARLEAAIQSEPVSPSPPPAPRITRVYKIPAQGSASSGEIAAAAASPADPSGQARWDPVNFIRSAAPEKSRA